MGERPRNFITVDKQTVDRLISNNYLHSNTFNFKNAVAITSVDNAINYKDLQETTKNKMQSLITAAKAREQNFYHKFDSSINNIDDFQKLLMKSNGLYKILMSLNDKQLIDSLNSSEDKFQEVAFNEFATDIQKKVLQNPRNANKQDMIINGVIKKAFNNALEGKDKIHKIKSIKSKSPVFLDWKQNFKTERNLQRLNGKEDFKKFILNIVENKINSTPIDNISKPIDAVQKRIILDDIGEAFDEMFNQQGKEEKLILNQNSNIIGYIGEFIGYYLFRSFFKKISRDSKKIKYIGDTIEGDGKKLKPPVDILVEDYGIQVKNSLSESVYNNVQIQNSIILNTLIDQKLKISNPNQIKYLLANIVFLSKFGLNYKGDTDPLSTKDKSYNAILEYVSMIFSNYIDVLISAEMDDKKIATGRKNDFFLYKSIYLIPVSYLYQGVLNYIIKEEEKSSVFLNKNMRKEIKLSDAEINENSKSIQQNKRLLTTNSPKNQLTYPNALLEYGKSNADKVLNKGKVTLNFTFDRNKLEDTMRSLFSFR